MPCRRSPGCGPRWAPARIIGAAIGIIMERYEIDAETAFAFLARISQNGNRKLRDVAEDIVSNRKIPAQAGSG